MDTTTRKARTIGAVIIALGVSAAALSGCSSSGSTGTPSADSTEYTLWDPYPDRDASSTWAKAIDACASEIGITIKRNAGNTGDTVKDLTTAAGNLPDIAMVDNPKVSTLADAGLLTTTEDNGFDVSNIEENILSAGEIDGKYYGVPIGANTLGLYYNEDVLGADTGVDPSRHRRRA